MPCLFSYLFKICFAERCSVRVEFGLEGGDLGRHRLVLPVARVGDVALELVELPVEMAKSFAALSELLQLLCKIRAG